MLNLLPSTLTRLLPGLGISITVGFAATFLSNQYGAPAMLFALLLGLALSFLYEEQRSAAGIDVAARTVLQLGVALHGFRIALGDIQSLGVARLLILVAGVATTIGFGILVGRLLGMSKRQSVLTGGAVGICGASAALAIASVMPASPGRDRDTALAVVGVTSLSTLAMILYPLLVSYLGLTASESGFFVGATIHDIAQVIGAGYSISTEAGDQATLSKLLRVAMLLPVVFCIGWAWRSKSAGVGTARLPEFLLVFAAIVIANSFLEIPQAISDFANGLSRFCLVTAIAAIGLRSNLRSILGLGARPLILMLLETFWLAALVYVALIAIR